METSWLYENRAFKVRSTQHQYFEIRINNVVPARVWHDYLWNRFLSLQRSHCSSVFGKYGTFYSKEKLELGYTVWVIIVSHIKLRYITN